MKKKIRRVISLAASLATISSINVAILSNETATVLAAENEPDMSRSIVFDHSVLKDGSDTKDADIVYFGNLGDDEKTAVPYRVIGYDRTGCVSTDASYRAVVLYSDISLFTSKFNEDPAKKNAYHESTLHNAVKDYTKKGLSEQERSAILLKDLPVSLYTENYGCGGVAGGWPVWDQLMWPLSTGEATGLPSEIRAIEDTVLCSPGKPDDPNTVNVPNNLIACIDNSDTEKGRIINDGVDIGNDFKVRLGVSVKFSNIVMLSAVSDGKGKISGETGPDALKAVEDYDLSGISSWKMTLKDGSRNKFRASLTGDGTVEAGKKVSISYENAKNGANEFVSVMLFDAKAPDRVLYYGRIAQDSVSGTADVTIPSGLYGKYVMKIYSEQYNGEKLTDLASSFVCIDLTVIQPASVLESPVALDGLAYNGKEQALIIPGCAVNGSMKYKIGEDGTYSEDVPKAKNAGEYKVYYKVFGNDGFADIEEHAISVFISKAHATVTPDNILKVKGKEDPALTAKVSGLADGDTADMISYTISRVAGEDEGIYQINTDGKKDQGNYEVSFGTGAFTIEEGEIIYTISDNMNGSYNIGCKKDLVITVKRNINDHKTFDNYKESTIDGKTVTKEQGTTSKGSLVLTLKSSYLDTLSEGEHKIKVSFTDGEALATVNIGKVKGKSLPKTGDTSVDKTPLAWMLIITAAAGITMTVLIEKKRHK